MYGIIHVSTATKIPGIRPNEKAMTAVNTVSRKSGNLKKFIKKTLRRMFSEDAKTQRKISLITFREPEAACFKPVKRGFFPVLLSAMSAVY
jgi:hypothetical protein